MSNCPPVRCRAPYRALVASFRILALIGAARAASAQVTPPAPASADDDTVLMSAFTVDAAADRGYRATSTLAGSRLRTELKDVAASISVATKDFMQDINATDAADLLVYTLGTEVSGQGGNFSAASIDASWANMDWSAGTASSTPTRVRGLAAADQTRDYFLTNIQFDNYNIDRVEVSRGPNSILYGLGSPGGIINASTIQPRWDKRASTLELQYGRFGSSRVSLDHNEVVIPNKLALRFAAKYSDDRFLQEEAYIRDRRAFLAGTFRPFKNTTIRANYEAGDQSSRRPQLRPPYDAYSWWWDIGKPVYDPTTGVLTLTSDVRTVSPLTSGARTAGSAGTGINEALISAGGIGNWGQGVGIVYSNPNSGTPGLLGYNVYGLENSNLRGRLDASGGLATSIMRGLQLPVSYYRSLHAGEVGGAFWSNQMMSDESVFDYRHHMIEGVNKGESGEWDAYNVTLEQTFLDGKAGVELVYDRQSIDTFTYTPYSWLTYFFAPDINVKLPNGDPNPNFGRPVLADVGWGTESANDREAKRATAYYNLDLRETGGGGSWLGRLLGQHVFTGSFTRQEMFSESFGGRPMMTGLDYYASESANESYNVGAQNDRRTLVHVSYVGPSAAGLANAGDLRVQPLRAFQNPNGYTSIPILYYQSPAATATTPAAWTVRDISVFGQSETEKKLTANWDGLRTGSEIDSTVFVWQGRLLNDTIIPTVGWRRDAYKTYNAGGAQFDPATGLMITDERFYWSGPEVDTSEESVNWGAVAHAPRSWLKHTPFISSASVFYNSADNTTAGSSRVDIYGDAIAPSSGESKEYGVALSLFDDKFTLRLTKFETNILDSSEGTVSNAILNIVRLPGWIDTANAAGVNADKPNAVAAWNTWASSAEGQAQIARFDSFSTRIGNLGSTTDVTSEGYELEATYNPLPNWRITFNGSKTEASRANSVAELVQFVSEMQPVWTGPASALAFQDNNNQSHTLNSLTTSDIIAPIRLAASQDGVNTQELRKWRSNFITNYTFRNGFLRGFNVGGAVRWQDKVGIGYGAMRDPVTGQDVYDVSRAYYGPAQTNYDAWIGYRSQIWGGIDWSLQLNVKNLFADDDLIPVLAQPDGSIAAYRIPEPTLWTLSSRFEF